MKIDNDDITAIAGTVIIHLIALLLLYFTVLRTLVPVDDGGVPVVFGDLYTSVGIYQPPPSTVPQQKQTPSQTTTVPVPRTEEKLITQNKEETVSIPDKPKVDEKKIAEEKAKKEKEKEDAERKRREEDERKRREEELRKQQEAINNRVSNAFGIGSSQDNQQGSATAGTANQGSPFGNSPSGQTEGTGGFGSFNLSGRSLGSGGLPRPVDTGQEEYGKIVINITVDPDGNVISADVGQGTNIDKLSQRNSALNAAKSAKFNKIQGANNQRGTITYKYERLLNK